MELSNIVESLLFVADQPVQPSFILKVLNPQKSQAPKEPENGESESGEEVRLPESEMPIPKAGEVEISAQQLEEVLDGLLTKYQDSKYPFEIRKVAEGYQFYTKKAYYPFVRKASVNRNQKRLSKAAMETLSIIAYRQPITKTEMEFIRGVSCDYAVQKLLEKKLVSILGRSDAPGRPLLYGTSPFFMEYFGLADMSDMPKLKEFEELEEDHLEMFRQHQLEKQGEDHDKQAKVESAVLEGNAAGSGPDAESQEEIS
ncbi:SMC-Scp complex subunit ScpB [Pontibacter sp. G13]|uniref:SMC-Scp complex subunit ScpB n=1 Tax=Pontibacter sp. G13 TaxID=3074898 RepID=UPI00288C2467|nr:SMC-Scp complex subunit ScpB [Pontibacter sp. G13]WNJ16442.1 SMC-Scp complex subunit ScpB [Pontibacter sp. G13]